MGVRTRMVVGGVVLAVVLGVACSDGEGESRDAAADEESADSSATDGGSRAADESEAGRDEGSGDEGAGGGEDDGLVAPEDIEAPEGSDPELRRQYIDQLVAAAGDESTTGLPNRALACLSTAYVDAAGTEALSAVVTPEELAANQDKSPREVGIELPEGAGDAFYDELASCVDMRGVYLDGTSGGDPAVRACLDEAIDEEVFRAYLIATFVGDPSQPDPELSDRAQEMEDAARACAGG